MLKEDVSRGTATQRNEAGRRQPAEVKSSPTVLLPAAGNQYGKEVNVLKREAAFLARSPRFGGRVGLNASAWLWTFLFFKKREKRNFIFF